MKIATWNVNSIKARGEHVKAWLMKNQPDLLLIQELKGQAENFPYEEMEALGYHAHVKGQKAYNGVAILAKDDVKLITDQLPGMEEDEQARFIEVEKDGVRYASIYAPNGNPLGTEKFSYKLKFLGALRDYMKMLLEQEISFVFAGDYNIIPEELDCENPKEWADDALFQPESRALYREMLNLGVTDAYRALKPNEHKAYSFWGYQAGAWQRDAGIRIDHFLLSPDQAEKLKSCEIDREERAREQPSDHVPVMVEVSA